MHTVLPADTPGGETSIVNGAFQARETVPWPESGKAIITGAVSCVTSQCDFVGAGLSQLSQIGSSPVQDYLAR